MTRTIQIVGAPLLLALSSCATTTVDDIRPTGGGRTYDLSYSTAYRIVLDTLEEMKFSIKKDDPGQGEIRAQTDKYSNGIFICEGNIFGIFFTQVGNSHTRVEIQSLYVRPHADLACKENAQRTVSEITNRLKQSSNHPSLQNQATPMAVVPSQPQQDALQSHPATKLEFQPKDNPVRIAFDFRKTNWGMSKEDVKKAELGHLANQSNNVLMYSEKVAGKDVLIGYVFIADKLVRSRYTFSEQHTNPNLFINDYMEIKEILTDKYGQPVEDKPVWSNQLYRNSPQDWGTAVSAGHLSFVTHWDTPATSIFHILKGDNFKIVLITEYESKELRMLEKQFKQGKDLSDF